MTSADDGMPPRMLTCVETKVCDLLNRVVALVKAGWSREANRDCCRTAHIGWDGCAA